MRDQAQKQQNRWTKPRKLQFKTKRLSGRIRPDQAEEEITEVETTPTETASIAITANLKGTNRKNAEKE